MNKFKRSCLLLCLAFCLCVGYLLTDSITVCAFVAEDNFYPINKGISRIYVVDTSNNKIFNNTISLSDNNKYELHNDVLTDISYIEFSEYSMDGFTFPFEPNSYDYYLLGTVVTPVDNSGHVISTFKPTIISVGYYNYESHQLNYYPLSDTNIYNIDSVKLLGYGFSTKIDFSSANNQSIYNITMSHDVDGSGVLPPDIEMEFGIMAVEKGTSEVQILGQILNKLDEMESSITSSIGNAADEVVDSIENQYKVDENEDFGVGDIQEQVEQKLGVLNFGADTLNNFLGLFSPSNAGDTSITFPSFSITIQGVKYQVWNDIQFDLSFLDQHFGVLMTAVRTITVLSVWLAVLQYLVKAKDQLINNRG